MSNNKAAQTLKNAKTERPQPPEDFAWIDELPNYTPPPGAPDAVKVVIIGKKPKKQKG